MATIPVRFEYVTGLKRPFIRAARLTGSWDDGGRYSDDWSSVAMEEFTAEDGCPAFRATVELDGSQAGRTFHWGVSVDTAASPGHWGIPTEESSVDSTRRRRSFTLEAGGDGERVERYYLTYARRLGANKLFVPGREEPVARFALWAPNAQAVDLVFGDRTSGYIWPDGSGEQARFAMQRGPSGFWEVDGTGVAELARFEDLDHQPYMYRITKDDGSVAYRSDLYSRCQIGSGGKDPEHDSDWNGHREDLDGVKACSVVINPDTVVRPYIQLDDRGNPVWPETDWASDEEFWADEFDPNRPVPTRMRDLVIYELHIDGLGAGKHERGLLEDAIELLDYLADLGVNAIEIMPLSEYDGWVGWGYGTSHYMTLEYSSGGRDQFKHFIRACHQRGIAVILDVVYNHFTPDGERAEWAYDSNAHDRNIYYWYEGHPDDYPAFNAAVPPGQQGHGGYIDNMSTGYAPRYWDETVRKMFCSSAAMLSSAFHIDGFRVDQTTSIHSYAVLHADGSPADSARVFGAKFLREWTRTVKLVNPNAFLMAEDHSGWSAVKRSSEEGGLGFDATWYSDFYHHLIGDTSDSPDRARLLAVAGYGGDGPLNVSAFAEGPLGWAADNNVVYQESHDEAGNSTHWEGDREVASARTIVVAVNGAPLEGETRAYAEARTRVVAGITFTSPGVPMFFMGEEVGASQPYRYDDFLSHREDFHALRQGSGARLFAFYSAAIHLRRAHEGLKSRNIDVVHIHDVNRVMAYRRWEGGEEFLVVASLSNHPFAEGYRIENSRIPGGSWREVLTSDADRFGGSGMTNDGTLTADGGLTVRLPANSILVFQRQ